MTINFGAAMEENPQVPAAIPTTIEEVKRALAEYSDAIDGMITQAEKHIVKNDATVELAVNMAGQAKKLNNRIEKQRKEIVEEPNQFVKGVNALAKGFQTRLANIEAGLKKKIGDYQYKKELERREAERKAREEAEKLQAELNKEAEEKNVDPVKVVAQVVPEEKKTVRTEEGSSYQVKTWVCEIGNPLDVPREYCVPNQALLNNAVKMGVREIPGCRIYEKTDIRLRT